MGLPILQRPCWIRYVGKDVGDSRCRLRRLRHLWRKLSGPRVLSPVGVGIVSVGCSGCVATCRQETSASLAIDEASYCLRCTSLPRRPCGQVVAAADPHPPVEAVPESPVLTRIVDDCGHVRMLERSSRKRLAAQIWNAWALGGGSRESLQDSSAVATDQATFGLGVGLHHFPLHWAGSCDPGPPCAGCCRALGGLWLIMTARLDRWRCRPLKLWFPAMPGSPNPLASMRGWVGSFGVWVGGRT